MRYEMEKYINEFLCGEYPKITISDAEKNSHLEKLNKIIFNNHVPIRKKKELSIRTFFISQYENKIKVVIKSLFPFFLFIILSLYRNIKILSLYIKNIA